jgi:hypothetical protein
MYKIWIKPVIKIINYSDLFKIILDASSGGGVGLHRFPENKLNI